MWASGFAEPTRTHCIPSACGTAKLRGSSSNIAAVAADVPRDDSTKSAADRQEVVNLSFLELQKRLKDGKITANAVLESYRAQAARAHAHVNCLTEFLPAAIKVAQARSRSRRCSARRRAPFRSACIGCCVVFRMSAFQRRAMRPFSFNPSTVADCWRLCVEQSVLRKRDSWCWRLEAEFLTV